MIIDNLEQGSEEWKLLRLSKITASDISSIIGVNPFKSRDKLMHCKKTGYQEPTNEAMQRGTILEPYARELYEEQFGYKMTPTVHVGVDAEKSGDCTWVNHDWAMCSTDGLKEDGTVVLLTDSDEALNNVPDGCRIVWDFGGRKQQN